MNFCLYSIKISGFRIQVMPISGLCTIDVGVLPRLNAKSPGTRAQPELTAPVAEAKFTAELGQRRVLFWFRA